MSRVCVRFIFFLIFILLQHLSAETSRQIKLGTKYFSSLALHGIGFPYDPAFMNEWIDTCQDGTIIVIGKNIIELHPTLKIFFETVHPRLPRYILITWSDAYAPSRFKHYLNEDKLISWFTINPDVFDHPKLIPLPIGLNSNFNIDYNIVDQCIEENRKKSKNKLILLTYLSNNGPERDYVRDIFKKKSFCHIMHKLLPPLEYLSILSEYKFVVSPRGMGEDCFRTWEAMILGVIPVVRKTPTMNPLYNKLPILIVDRWEDVTAALLKAKYREIKNKEYNLKKLFAQYWLDLFAQKQNDKK